MSFVMRLAMLTLFAVASANMWRQRFELQPALWVMSSQGQLTEADSVFHQQNFTTECGCVTACLVRERCLSYSYHTILGTCTMYHRRGNVQVMVHAQGVHFRFRRGLALLGDWCDSSDECRTLTVGPVFCADNTCKCADHLSAFNWTHCEESNFDNNTNQTSTFGTSTIGTNFTVIVTTPDAGRTDTTNNSPSTNATQTTGSTLNTGTPAATEPTRTAESSDASRTTNTLRTTVTSGTTGSATMEVATSTTHVSTGVDTSVDARTTVTSTSATSRRTIERSTDAATTQAVTETARTTSVIYQDQDRLRQPRVYTTDCSYADGERSMIGIHDEPYKNVQPLDDIDYIICAGFPSFTGLHFDYGELTEVLSHATDWNECPANATLVGLADWSRHMNSPDFYRCARLSAGYWLDSDSCHTVTVTPPYQAYTVRLTGDEVEWPLQCNTSMVATSVMTGFVYDVDRSPQWRGIKCCAIRRQRG